MSTTPLSASAAAIEASFLSPASSAMEMSPGEAINTIITEGSSPSGLLSTPTPSFPQQSLSRVDRIEMNSGNEMEEGGADEMANFFNQDGKTIQSIEKGADQLLHSDRKESNDVIGGEGKGGGNRQGLTVKVTSSRFVAAWRWTVAEADEVCGICRMAFESCCPSCKFAGDECPPLVGVCKHAYHLHCIHNWLAAKDKEQVCPLCRRPWE
jgi:anaphase-promoting complex subunit 11